MCLCLSEVKLRVKQAKNESSENSWPFNAKQGKNVNNQVVR